MGVVPVTVFAQWEFRILLARSTMYMSTLCAMETIHLLDKEREVESECRVPEKPIARRAQPLPGPPPSAATTAAAESGGERDRRSRADPALRRSITFRSPSNARHSRQSTYRDKDNYLLVIETFQNYKILIFRSFAPVTYLLRLYFLSDI